MLNSPVTHIWLLVSICGQTYYSWWTATILIVCTYFLLTHVQSLGWHKSSCIHFVNKKSFSLIILLVLALPPSTHLHPSSPPLLHPPPLLPPPHSLCPRAELWSPRTPISTNWFNLNCNHRGWGYVYWYRSLPWVFYFNFFSAEEWFFFFCRRKLICART